MTVRRDMNGRERIMSLLQGKQPDRVPFLPIAHTAFASLLGEPLGRYFTDAACMASVTCRAAEAFGLDGVQLSLGVTAEAQALGAAVLQEKDRAPVLTQHLLAGGLDRLSHLPREDIAQRGRFPLFCEAVSEVLSAIGEKCFVLVTLRGPLLIASQLRGVKRVLMDMIEDPEDLEVLLEFSVGAALKVGEALRRTGAHGVVVGEAVCSPSFISPELYRRCVLAHHRRLVSGLKEMSWAVGLHICGKTAKILSDILATGVDFFDLDSVVPPHTALSLTGGRVVIRGNLDPSSVFRFGTPASVRTATEELLESVRGTRWIVSSGCDIPPGTSFENVRACAEACGVGAD